MENLRVIERLSKNKERKHGREFPHGSVNTKSCSLFFLVRQHLFPYHEMKNSSLTSQKKV
jgi:hypothetical protein